MRLAIDISPELMTLLDERATLAGKTPEVVAAQLLAFAVKETRDLPQGTRIMVVGGKPLERLEQVLGGGSILNQGDLQRKVERLAGISFMHVRLPFTPNQLETLGERAQRQGMSVQQLVDRTAPRIYEHFFNLMERTTG